MQWKSFIASDATLMGRHESSILNYMKSIDLNKGHKGSGRDYRQHGRQSHWEKIWRNHSGPGTKVDSFACWCYTCKRGYQGLGCCPWCQPLCCHPLSTSSGTPSFNQSMIESIDTKDGLYSMKPSTNFCHCIWGRLMLPGGACKTPPCAT